MRRFETHICLVSEQPTPNLLPTLDERFRPRSAILVVSPEMKRYAKKLAEVMRQQGLETSLHQVRDARDLRLLQEDLLELAVELEGKDVALNVTGGTKPMAIAAQQAMSEAGLDVFYVRLDNDQVVFLGDRGSDAGFSLESRLKLKQYLQAHGIDAVDSDTRSDMHASWWQLCQDMIRKTEQYNQVIGSLNAMAVKAENEPGLSSRWIGNQRDAKRLEALVDLFASEGILSRTEFGVSFPNEEARFFTAGGWLEEVIFDIVKRIKGVHDSAKSLRIVSGKSSNEIDIAFLAANTLHLIECKTRNLTANTQSGPEAIYKLDSLAGLGGLRTRGLLVSYRPLRGADKQRAKDLGVRAFQITDDLEQLKQEIRSFAGL